MREAVRPWLMPPWTSGIAMHRGFTQVLLRRIRMGEGEASGLLRDEGSARLQTASVHRLVAGVRGRSMKHGSFAAFRLRTKKELRSSRQSIRGGTQGARFTFI